MVRRISAEELPGHAERLLNQVVKQSGYPVVIVEEEGLGYDSLVAFAGQTQPFHELAYVPAYRPHRAHFVVNALMKIQRYWSEPPEERLIPVSDANKGLPTRDERELRRKLGRGPPCMIEEISRFLHRGTVRQLTSMPLDIRVEREIADAMPEHREHQQAYLARQIKDLEPHFMLELAQVVPERLYAAATAMNIVLCEEAAEIANVEPGALYTRSPHRELGARLREILRSVRTLGHSGDRVLTDAWAEELGLRTWYEWRRLDEVR